MCLIVIPAIGIGVTIVTIVGVITVSISQGIAISVTIVCISISLSSGLSISRPLANALDRSVGVGGAIGMTSDTVVQVAIRMTITIGQGIAIAVAVVCISLRLSISRPLTKALGRSVLIGGCSGVVCRIAIVPIGVAIVAILSRGISLRLRLGISRPLGKAPEAGGGESGGRDSGPVRVGVVEGRVGGIVGSVEEARVSLRIRGSRAPGQQGTHNLNTMRGKL